MPATLEEILGAIATALKPIKGLWVADTDPGQINPPQAVVGVPAIPSYHTAQKGRRPDLEPTITVYVSTTLNRGGQLQLAGYASPDGPSSIPAAIARDRTLGGVVDECKVTGFAPLGIEEVALVGYYGGRFTLRVLT
jgi:hypothetical protein